MRVQSWFKRSKTNRKTTTRTRPLGLESLEPRLLLFATSGGEWPVPDRVTVSFVPDGADIGGVTSNLFSNLNAKFQTATWQKEMLRGLQAYTVQSNLNFSLVPDDGSKIGTAGTNPDDNMQGDKDFGDIRIGGAAYGTMLGGAWLPPPIYNETGAGDFSINTLYNWQIGSGYDLFTIAAHEGGHALGLCHSQVVNAVMYGVSYQGPKTDLSQDDIDGAQAIYGPRPGDAFDNVARNETKSTPTVITSHIDSNFQINLHNLDITGTSDVDWYKITVPQGTSGQITVRVVSEGLSLFAPKVSFTRNDGSVLDSASGSYHSVVSVSHSISKGQNRLIKVEGAESGAFGTGKYSLQVNMGTQASPAVPITNTATPSTHQPPPPGICSGALENGHNHDHDHDHGFVGDYDQPANTGSSDQVTTTSRQRGDRSESDEGRREKETRKTPKRAIVADATSLKKLKHAKTAAVDELLASGQLGALTPSL